jgi:hypothetical protein
VPYSVDHVTSSFVHIKHYFFIFESDRVPILTAGGATVPTLIVRTNQYRRSHYNHNGIMINLILILFIINQPQKGSNKMIHTKS